MVPPPQGLHNRKLKEDIADESESEEWNSHLMASEGRSHPAGRHRLYSAERLVNFLNGNGSDAFLTAALSDLGAYMEHVVRDARRYGERIGDVIVGVEASEYSEVNDFGDRFLSKVKDNVEAIRVLNLLGDQEDFHELPYHVRLVSDVARPRARLLELLVLLRIQNLRNPIGPKESTHSFGIVNLFFITGGIFR